MDLYATFDAFKASSRNPLVLGIGNFDGVHEGHRALLRRVSEKARECCGKTAVFTFREHPQHILHPRKKPHLLTDVRHKLILFSEIGVEVCFLIPFTRKFSQMTAREFVEKVLVERLNVRGVALGFNARFGHDRSGDVRLMGELAKEFGFEFVEASPVTVGSDFVSSSRIRKLVEGGDLEEAEECLGRPYSILAPVVHGVGRGKGLGYPTANLDVRDRVMPPEGVYPVLLRVLDCGKEEPGALGFEKFSPCLSDRWFAGAMNFGRRPTFDSSEKIPCAEVFILDFQGDLYGKSLEVVFFPRIRGEIAFEDAGALKKQIAEDIRQVRQFCGSLKNSFTSSFK